MMTTTELDRTTFHTTGNDPASSRLLPRVAGIARFDPDTAREIARSPRACGQAVLVVLGVAVTGMIVSQPASFGGAVFDILGVFATWILSALLIAELGAALVGTPTTRVPSRRATLRLLGFAQAPLMIGTLGVIDPLAGVAGLVAWVLMMAATAFAVRHLLHVSWVRALIATAAAQLAVAVLLGALGIVFQTGDGLFVGF